jgi:rhodanese-related sulfurtransferase
MQTEFLDQCFESRNMMFVTPSKAFPFLMEGLLLLDLRPDYEGAGKIPDVPRLLQIPYSEIDQKTDAIPKDEIVVLADAVGIRSKEVMQKLTKLGFANLVSLAGGLLDWEREGFPMIIDLGERLTGSCMCQLKPRDRARMKRNNTGL